MGWRGGQAPPAPNLTLVSRRISSQQRPQRETVELQSAPKQTRRNCVATGRLSKKPHGIKANPQPQLHTKTQEVLPCKWYLCSAYRRASLQLLICQHHVLPHRHPKAACRKKQQRWVFSGLSQIIPRRASWKKHLFLIIYMLHSSCPQRQEKLFVFLLWDEYGAVTLSNHSCPGTDQQAAQPAAATATSPSKRRNNPSQ